MRLVELFDKPVQYTLKHISDHEYRAHFIVGEVKYDMSIDCFPVRQYINPEFSKTVGNDTAYDAEKFIIDNSTPRDQIIAVEFIGRRPGQAFGSTTILGTGNQFVVFSTVITAIKEVISKTNPKWVMFSAEEQSRIKLYLRMAKALSKGEPLIYRGGYGGEPDVNFVVRLR